MKNLEEAYFEIVDIENAIRLEPINRIDYQSEMDWDNNWLNTKVNVQGGKFTGEYSENL